MQSARTWVLAAAAVLAAVAVWLQLSSPGAEAQREADRRLAEPVAASRPPPILTVDVHRVESSDARMVVDIAGQLAAARAVVVAAEVDGRVVEVAVQDHTAVVEGEVLVRLDPVLREAAVKRAEAALLRSEAEDRLAQSEVKRQRDLARQGVSSSAELDRAESDAKASAARVVEAQADLIDATTRLEKTRIAAPFDGVVGTLQVDPGAFVRPGDRITDLADLAEIEIEVGVTEREILALADGGPVQISVAALPGEWFTGHIQRRGRIPDTRTRKYPVPVRVPNLDGRLLPGMLGTVRFELGEARSALHVPARAIVREFDLEHVWVLVPEADAPEIASAHRRRVTTRPLAFRPDLVEVVSGLQGSERIAISAVRELREDLRVRTRERRTAEMADGPRAGAPPR